MELPFLIELDSETRTSYPELSKLAVTKLYPLEIDAFFLDRHRSMRPTSTYRQQGPHNWLSIYRGSTLVDQRLIGILEQEANKLGLAS